MNVAFLTGHGLQMETGLLVENRLLCLNPHYEAKHTEKYKNLPDAEQEWISDLLLAKLQGRSSQDQL